MIFVRPVVECDRESEPAGGAVGIPAESLLEPTAQAEPATFHPIADRAVGHVLHKPTGLVGRRAGIAAAVTWEIGRQLLASWLIGSKYTSAYGVVGSFIAILLWSYYSITVVLMGAEFIQTYAKTDNSHDDCAWTCTLSTSATSYAFTVINSFNPSS